LKSPKGDRYYRKIITIRAEDSPSVKLALAQIEAGQEPTYEVLIPGCIDYELYEKRRALWDPIRQCIGLDATFYEGAEVKMFPPAWLNLANLNSSTNKNSWRSMGVDPAEGGDNTVWTVIDKHKIHFQESMRTPDTSIIPDRTIAYMKAWGVDAGDVLFDRGGGGKEHADVLRARGHKVRTVGFGEPAWDPFQDKRMRTSKEKDSAREERYVYKNRRAEMYGMARMMINPDLGGCFGISNKYEELIRQLSFIPLQFDDEGRMYLPPKDKKTKDSNEITLKEILGCSPDEGDSFALACFGQQSRARKSIATAL